MGRWHEIGFLNEKIEFNYTDPDWLIINIYLINS